MNHSKWIEEQIPRCLGGLSLRNSIDSEAIRSNFHLFFHINPTLRIGTAESLKKCLRTRAKKLRRSIKIKFVQFSQLNTIIWRNIGSDQTEQISKCRPTKIKVFLIANMST